ncbi:MAG: hypothetical protein ACR2IV_12300 [Bryobacteraceae bacterium]
MLKFLAGLLAHALTAFSLTAPLTVPMNRYDRFPTGANTQETSLNSTNVNAANFGKLYSYYVDGAVYAQPLYVPAVRIPGQSTHNVLYVATMNDKVYAFDADRSGPPLWMRNLTNEISGVTPVPIIDITNSNDLNIVGNAGIESTPVIDASEEVIYLVARTKENGKYVQRLHKLDIKDGKDQAVPVMIEASVNSSARDAVNGMLHFDPRAGNQRSALALVDGTIVIAWASHEDIQPYHGWIMTYDARALKQTGALCTTPDTADGGIWQSGRGPAIGSDGGLYFEVGNGGWDGHRNFGTSVVKLNVRNSGVIEDYFTPHDYVDLNDQDADLGSTGPLLIPGTNILVCGSKKGIVYLLDANKLGHMTANNDRLIQALEVNGGRIMAGPVYWDGPAGPMLFLWCETDVPKAFRFNGHLLQPTPYAKGIVASRGSPGGALTISSNGTEPATGVLWATVADGRSADHGNAPGVLHAFNAENLKEIWNSEQHMDRDRLGTLVKFVPPLVAVGKVYAPNYDNAVNVYGLLSWNAAHTRVSQA